MNVFLTIASNFSLESSIKINHVRNQKQDYSLLMGTAKISAMNTKKSLRLLLVEDSENDAQLLLRELRKGPYEITHERTYSAEGMRAALEKQEWDIIISD